MHGGHRHGHWDAEHGRAVPPGHAGAPGGLGDGGLGDGGLEPEDSEDLAEENPDEFRISSIGVDIGSATSHLLISRLTMRRLGKSMMSRYVVVGRESLYSSPVSLTPYRPDGLIDADQLQQFVRSCHEDCGIDPAEIDTGVVLLTGEALRRENARAIASLLSDRTGRFVCASAGHHLESRVAAHGAGTVEASRADGTRLLNLDIGGGTAKLALVEGGEIVATGAVNVGGRLIAIDEAGRVVRMEPAAETVAESLGIGLRLGAVLAEHELGALADRLADCLLEVLADEEPLSALTEALLLTGRVRGTREVDSVVLSGGVSEYFDAQPPRFGDLAGPLAAALRPRLRRLYGNRVRVSRAGLRATVVGLSQFTVEASGDTIYVSSPSPLPLRNVPMLKVALPDDPSRVDIAAAVVDAASAREVSVDELVGVALDWNGVPRYTALAALVAGLHKLLLANVHAGHPGVVVVSQDCARSLGHLLQEQLGPGVPLVCIDGLSLGDLDFIDIGAPVPGKTVVPVVVKSLLFPSVQA